MNDFDPHDVTQDYQAYSLPPNDAAPVEHPKRIGRYRIDKVLGKGGFGLVYLAHDEQLDRLVAIKLPHAKLLSKPEDAEAYLAEARTVANLDHPHIVPVFDVGSTDDCPCFTVSRYIEGTSLVQKIKESRLNYSEATELVATIAEALHYAHKQGLVHRDVKPGNILIDGSGEPFLADFGLALREENFGKGPVCAGTPAYMSPEQARGEGHRVDGRSDIFSLGVVLYELLVGRRPFRGDTQSEIFEQIVRYEPRPPRQYDDRIPKELERICHAAMAKRASDRYTTAKDFAEDLRLFLQEQTVIQSKNSAGSIVSSPPETLAAQGESTKQLSIQSPTVESETLDSQPIKIVPKGLRSFDAHDTEFFLELLPGPRDRSGLPDTLRFWKTRIEESDPDNTFSVGLIYGPSGCGKSSFVKAGLLPRFCDDVIPVFIEATPDETETRLLHGLRKRCPALDDNLSLKDSVAALRRGQGIPVGKKVLIVLDQFEQWLHTNKEEENTDLVEALRQCNGGRVQCIVMVRDDFWMAVTRFMRELEVRLEEAENSAAVDLFSIRHAEKVLSAFGRAFGALPDSSNETSKEQKEFLKQSVKGLAKDGKVVCVRLALFAEMMKGKKWTPAALKQLGGTKGVGITFLEETFSVSTAPPQHRYHQKAARAVLKALLPDSANDIKGEMKSYDELLEVSGYARRPKDFDDLIRILDSEIRLITPTDPDGFDDEQSVVQTEACQKYYQLTHDYLVHSLQDWLTRKRKESKKGRAELALEDRASVWNARPENRQLPSLVQWLQIRWYTDRKRWTEPQKKMMATAGRYHTLRGLMAAVLLVAVTFGGLTIRNAVVRHQEQTYATALVDSLMSADITQVPNLVEDLKRYRNLAQPLLKDKIAQASDASTEKLKLALGLLPDDESQLDYLAGQLLVCTPKQFTVLRESVLPHKDKISETLWELVQDEQKPPIQRFQAAAALAEFTPEDERWEGISPFVAQHLTTVVSSVDIGSWVALLEPTSSQLIKPLTVIHANRSRNESEREAAAYALSEYLRDKPERLIDAILLADEHGEFSSLVDSLKPHAAVVKGKLLDEMQAEMPTELNKLNKVLSEEEQQLRDDHWKRQSLAAVTLVNLGYADEVWPLLEFTPNPSLRSFIIHHLGKLGTDHNTLAARLQLEQDDSIRRALIQSLGGLNVTVIPSADRNRISEQLKSLYVNDPDSGTHSSASWTLRQWGIELPELPVGEPTLSEEQKARIDKLTAEVEDIRQRIVVAEKELPIRQAAWERELAAKAGTALAAPSNGLIAHFSLNETEGRETVNAANVENVGIFVGPNEPKWIKGVSGNGLRLDGSKQRFDCGELFNPERTDAFSLGCWFYSDKEAENGTLFSKWQYHEEKGRGFIVETRPAEGKFRTMLHHTGWGDALIVESKSDLLRDHWHHLSITYDGSSKAEGIRCYFDGSLTQTRQLRNSLTGTIRSDKPLQIGTRNGPNAPFAGGIDDIRIYNRTLSEKEVEELFEAGVASLASTAPENRMPEQQKLLNDVYRPKDGTLIRLNSELAATEQLLHDARWNGLRRWYVNGQGQTMVIIPPQFDGQLDYAFAISTHEVTVEEFIRSQVKMKYDSIFSLTGDSPICGITFPEAAEYCNWLNEQKGIPEDQWACIPNEDSEYIEGMTARSNVHEINGYRLPTIQEWEFSCRAETTSSYYHGESISLLTNYASIVPNSMGKAKPVGTLLPNEIGLFDMFGNALEITHPSQDISLLSWRGGAWWFIPKDIGVDKGAASRGLRTRFRDGGMRLVRTWRPIVKSAQQELEKEGID